ncbi:MAG: hypothetical protein OQK12_11260, partial [Motiliproteus sp.]|nr:hypothetical protein [Motiliproteus sp.]
MPKGLLGRLSPTIDVKFLGHDIKAIPLELLNMLVVGSTYEGVKRITDRSREQKSFEVQKIEGSRQGNKIKNWWVALRSTSGELIYIRHVELARVLFLHNTHLVRAAFRPAGLGSLADIVREDGATQIRFNGLCNYPLSHLKTRQDRAHLAWLYLDERAEKSVHSIFRYFQQCESSDWQFRFDPPDLRGWTFSGYIQSDQAQQYLRLAEVTGLDNPWFEPPRNLSIYHPSYREPEDAPGKRKRPVITKDTPELEVDFHEIPGITQGEHLQREGGGFCMTFRGQDLSSLTGDRTRIATNPLVKKNDGGATQK